MHRRTVLRGAAAAAALTLAGCANRRRNRQGPGTIVDVARADGRFATLLSVMDTAGLTATLTAPGPFTLFAPTDTAFAQAPPNAVDRLMQQQNRAQLGTLLAYHVIAGRIGTADLPQGRSRIVTLQGSPLSLDWNGVLLRVNGALAPSTNIEASNGLIHAVDQVLLP
ncbi:fasciclin domain-containing protein [Halovulum sp. GXIMD14794]